jgi:hypothetical protein
LFVTFLWGTKSAKTTHITASPYELYKNDINMKSSNRRYKSQDILYSGNDGFLE